MNTTHIHLLLNHFPVIGTLIGSGLLLWGILKKQNNVKSAAAVILVIMAILAIPVYLTGEPAEESIEKLQGVSEAMIELHQNAATFAFWLIGITGLFSVIALFFLWQNRKKVNTFFVITFVLSVFCFAVMAMTGYYGGQIRHTEIRAGNISNEQNKNDKIEVDKDKGEAND